MKIYLVGGAVRDKLLGLAVKEKDYVVVGASVDHMLKLGYKQVGKEFPVFLHPKTNDEYALARMERKVGPGYKGFTFDTSMQVTLEEDLARRDLTINAMALDLDTQTIIDPYAGQQDLAARRLRHVSPAFAEDPVRILRVARFYARYAGLGFAVDTDTLQLMRTMVAQGEVDALVAERVWKELERALSETHPEKFFECLDACHALPILFPAITMHHAGMRALQRAAEMGADTIVRFAALCHDLGEDKQTIRTLCRRYRLPNAYTELAQLTASHFATALKAKQLTAEELIQFFNRIDIYRRSDRYLAFLTTCEAIAQATRCDFDRHYLIAAADAAKSVDVQALIAQGLTHAALAQALQHARQEKIAEWLSAQR